MWLWSWKRLDPACFVGAHSGTPATIYSGCSKQSTPRPLPPPHPHPPESQQVVHLSGVRHVLQPGSLDTQLAAALAAHCSKGGGGAGRGGEGARRGTFRRHTGMAPLPPSGAASDLPRDCLMGTMPRIAGYAGTRTHTRTHTPPPPPLPHLAVAVGGEPVLAGFAGGVGGGAQHAVLVNVKAGGGAALAGEAVHLSTRRGPWEGRPADRQW